MTEYDLHPMARYYGDILRRFYVQYLSDKVAGMADPDTWFLLQGAFMEGQIHGLIQGFEDAAPLTGSDEQRYERHKANFERAQQMVLWEHIGSWVEAIEDGLAARLRAHPGVRSDGMPVDPDHPLHRLFADPSVDVPMFQQAYLAWANQLLSPEAHS